MIYILNSRYLQRILVACDRNSKEWRCPKMSKDVQLSWSSGSQALQIVPHLPPSTLHPFSISTNILILIIIVIINVIIIITMYIIVIGRIKSAAMKILQN